MNNEALLLVASSSRPRTLAGAVAALVREGKKPILQAIGAAAVNQAVKGIAVARSYLREEQIVILAAPCHLPGYTGPWALRLRNRRLRVGAKARIRSN